MPRQTDARTQLLQDTLIYICMFDTPVALIHVRLHIIIITQYIYICIFLQKKSFIYIYIYIIISMYWMCVCGTDLAPAPRGQRVDPGRRQTAD